MGSAYLGILLDLVSHGDFGFISADQMLSYKLPNSNVLAALLLMFACTLGVIALLRHIRHP